MQVEAVESTQTTEAVVPKFQVAFCLGLILLVDGSENKWPWSQVLTLNIEQTWRKEADYVSDRKGVQVEQAWPPFVIEEQCCRV